MALRDRKVLTATQKETLDEIKRYIAVKGDSPTLEELAERLNVKLPSVADRIRGLIQKGYLYRSGRRWRNLRIVEHSPLEQSRMVSVPLTYSVGADNMTVFAEYEFGQYMLVPRGLLRGHREVFSVRVMGNSMRDAGIPDGSFVLAEEATLEDVGTGDRVIAIFGEMIVLKKLIRAENGIILEPENKSGNYSPIFVTPDQEDFRIVGRYIDVIRATSEDEEDDIEIIRESF